MLPFTTQITEQHLPKQLNYCGYIILKRVNWQTACCIEGYKPGDLSSSSVSTFWSLSFIRLQLHECPPVRPAQNFPSELSPNCRIVHRKLLLFAAARFWCFVKQQQVTHKGRDVESGIKNELRARWQGREAWKKDVQGLWNIFGEVGPPHGEWGETVSWYFAPLLSYFSLNLG